MRRQAGLFLCSALLACGDGGRVVESDGGDPQSSTDAGRPDGGRRDAGSGACSPACPSTATCVDGQCVLVTCTETETRCGAVCVDLSSDTQHCGSCARSCPRITVGETACVQGECGFRCSEDPPDTLCVGSGHCSFNHCCPNQKTWCDGQCISLLSDLDNCGACGHACEVPAHGGASCGGGACTTTCNQGYTMCSGSCVSVQTDTSNCGACGHACGAGQQCANGICIVSSTECSIDPTLEWQSCAGATVRSGDMLTMYASGMWTQCSGVCSYTGPEGLVDNPVPLGFEYRYDTSFNHGALLWAIDSGTRHAFPGGTVSTTAGASGTLMFRINDSNSALGNNDGRMDVTINVSR